MFSFPFSLRNKYIAAFLISFLSLFFITCSQPLVPLTPDILFIIEDEIAPVITIESPSNNSFYRSVIEVTGTILDSALEEDDEAGDISVIEYTIVDNSASLRTITFSATGEAIMTPEDTESDFFYDADTGVFSFRISTIDPEQLTGRKNISIKAVDQNENESDITISLDSYIDGPYIEILTPDPENPGFYEDVVTVTGTVKNSSSDPFTSEVDASLLQYRVANNDSILITEDEDFVYDAQTGSFSLSFDTTGTENADQIAKVDGNRNLRFRLIAYDLNGHSNTFEFYIESDESGPHLTILSPDPDYPGTYKSTVTVTGKIVNSPNDSDTDQVAYPYVSQPEESIQYKLENNNWISINDDNNFTYDPLTGDYQLTFDTTGQNPDVLAKVDGNLDLKIRAYDLNGLYTEESITIESDEIGPYISISSPDPENPGTYNSSVTVSGTIVNSATDSGTGEVDWASLEFKVENNDYISISPGDYNSDTGDFSITFDTTGNDQNIVAVDGSLSFKIRAADKNGLFSSSEFTIDSDNIGPYIVISSPDPDNPGTYDSSVLITGSIFNDNSLSSSSEVNSESIAFKVEYGNYITVSSFDGFTFDPATGQFSLQFDTTGLDDGIDAVEGTLDIKIKALDLNGLETVSEISIESDGSGPVIHIDSPVDGSYFASTVILSGSIEDYLDSDTVNECEFLFYQLPGENRVQLDFDSETGSFYQELDFSGINDPKIISFIAYDKNGEVTEEDIQLYNDNEGPYINVISPSIANRQFRSNVSVTGTISNDSSDLTVLSEVDSLAWAVAGTSLSGTISNAEIIANSGNFSFEFSPYDVGYSGTSLSLTIIGTDKNGNESEETILMTKYDQGMFIDIVTPSDQSKYSELGYEFTLTGSIRDFDGSSNFDELNSLICEVNSRTSGGEIYPVDLLVDLGTPGSGDEYVVWDSTTGEFTFFYSIPNSFIATETDIRITVIATDKMNVESEEVISLFSSTEGLTIDFDVPVVFNYTISDYDGETLYYSYNLANAGAYPVTFAGNIADYINVNYFTYESQLGLNASGSVDVRSSIDNSTGDFSFDIDFNSLSSLYGVQDYQVTVKIVDTRDKISDPRFIFVDDSIGPTVVVNDTHSDSLVKDSDTDITITATFTEADSGLDGIPTITIGTVVVDQPMTGSGNVWTYDWNIPAGSDGDHVVTFTYPDKVGNAADSPTAGTGSTTYTIDNTAPSGYDVSFDQGAFINNSQKGAVGFTFSGAEVGSTYFYNIDDSNGSTAPITGSAIIVKSSDNITGVDVSSLDDDTLTLTAYLIDPVGNQGSNVSDTAIKDTIPPLAPTSPDMTSITDSGSSNTDNITNITTPGFSGTAEADSTVTLYHTDTVSIGTGTATGGNWNITSSALSDSSYSLTAKAVDAAGNESIASSVLAIEVDTVVSAPSIPNMDDGSDTGNSNSDNITNDTTPTYSGTAENNSTVTLYHSGSVIIGTGSASGGNWNITSSVQGENDYSITAKAIDVAGNESSVSSSLPVTIDTSAPIFSSADDGGGDNNYKAGETITFDIDLGESGLTVSADLSVINPVFSSSQSFVDDTDNTYSYTTLDVDTGSNLIEVLTAITFTAIDVAGNSSTDNSLSLLFDKTAPAAPITLDLIDASDSGSSNSDDITNDSTPTITGSSEDGSTVTLYHSGSTIIGTDTATGGNWSITSSSLSDDPYSITAKAVDISGNESVASASLALTVDTTAPSYASVDDGGGDNNYKAGETVTFDLNLGETGLTVTADLTTINSDISFISDQALNDDADNTYSFTTLDVDTNASMIEGSATISFTAIDVAGNSSTDNSLNILFDKTAPVFSTVDDGGGDNNYKAGETVDFDLNLGETGLTVTADLTVLNSDSSFVSNQSLTDDGDNTYSLTTSDVDTNSSMIEGTTAITFIATDASGNTTTDNSLSLLLDKTAPVFTSVDDGGGDNNYKAGETVTFDLDLSETGLTVTADLTVINSDGSYLSDQSLADDGDNTYSFTTTDVDTNASMIEGTTAITFTAVDAAGNSSTDNSLNILFDKTAPVFTSVDDGGGDNNYKAGETVTFDLNMGETGLTVTADLTVINSDLSFVSNQSLNDDSDNTYSFITLDVDTGTTMIEGTAAITFTATDVSGNSSTDNSLSLLLDKSKPAAPLSLDLIASSDTGSSNTDNITNDTTPTITGTAEIGSTVTLYHSGTTIIGTDTATDGNWSITSTALVDNSYSVTAKAVDISGNESVASTALSITIDDTDPVFTSVDDGGGDNNYKAGETVTFDLNLGESGLTVSADLSVINTGFSSTEQLTDDLDNTYSFTTLDVDSSSDMIESSTAITFTATDVAGNSTSDNSLTLLFDKTAPVFTSVDDGGGDNNYKAGETVTFDLNLGETGLTVTADLTVINSDSSFVSNQSISDDGDNTYSYTTSDVDTGTTMIEGNTAITFSATDASGNTTTNNSLSILFDKTAPVFTSVDDNGGDNNYKAGETVSFDLDLSEAGLTVTADLTVINSDSSFVSNQSITDDGDNTYSYTTLDVDTNTSMIESSTAITFTAIDAAGNSSTDDSLTILFDKTAPTVENFASYDLNVDGTSDGFRDTIEIVFSETISDSSLGTPSDWGVSENSAFGSSVTETGDNDTTAVTEIVSDVSTEDQYMSFTFVGGKCEATGVVYIQYTGNSITDLAGNALASFNSTSMDPQARTIALNRGENPTTTISDSNENSSPSTGDSTHTRTFHASTSNNSNTVENEPVSDQVETEQLNNTFNWTLSVQPEYLTQRNITQKQVTDIEKIKLPTENKTILEDFDLEDTEVEIAEEPEIDTEDSTATVAPQPALQPSAESPQNENFDSVPIINLYTIIVNIIILSILGGLIWFFARKKHINE